MSRHFCRGPRSRHLGPLALALSACLAVPSGAAPTPERGSSSTDLNRSAVAGVPEATDSAIRTVPQLTLGPGVGVASGGRFVVDSAGGLVFDLVTLRVVHYWPSGVHVVRYLDLAHHVAIRLWDEADGILDLLTGRWICRTPDDGLLLDGVISKDDATCFLTHSPEAKLPVNSIPPTRLSIVDTRTGQLRSEVALPGCEIRPWGLWVQLSGFKFTEESPQGATIRLEARRGCPICRNPSPLELYQLEVSSTTGNAATGERCHLARTIQPFSGDVPMDLWGNGKGFRELDDLQRQRLRQAQPSRIAASRHPAEPVVEYSRWFRAPPECGLRTSYRANTIVLRSRTLGTLATFVRFDDLEWIAYGNDSIWDGSPGASEHVHWVRTDGELASREEIAALRNPAELRQRLERAIRCDSSAD